MARALCLDYERRLVRWGEVADAGQPGADEVLLKIAEVGVCATDRELARFRFGAPPAGESLMVLGHEALARVDSVGADVEGIEPGMWVAPMIRRACAARCRACAGGRIDLCQTGQYLERGIQGAHGYFRESVCDAATALVAVPERLLDVAVLAEPLSVVEKAIETGLRLAAMEPYRALVIGAGPVGLLAAMAMRLRGLNVTVASLEQEDGERARLARLADCQYRRGSAGGRFDLVLEASGGEGAGDEAIDRTGAGGATVLIGADERGVRLDPVRMIVDNLAVAGIVNAGRKHFEAAMFDLERMPRRLLDAMIERRRAEAWHESLDGGAGAVKLVHRIGSL